MNTIKVTSADLILTIDHKSMNERLYQFIDGDTGNSMYKTTSADGDLYYTEGLEEMVMGDVESGDLPKEVELAFQELMLLMKQFKATYIRFV